MVCLVIMVVGVVSIASMPVDLFPQIDMPVVVVATFYSGMPPKQIEADITDTFERFFTLGSNIDRIESRSLTGVSLIKIYFKPGTDANAAFKQHRQSGHGGLAATTPRYPASRSSRYGCFEPARLPSYAEG
jgi:multidrug efflux pump subunit AcrB